MTAMQRVIVHGRVQGVNFRSFVEHEANKRHLDGWVRNLRDGTVEAVFSGPEADVRAVIECCRIGSRHANVISLEAFPASEEDLKLRNAGEKFSRLN